MPTTTGAPDATLGADQGSVAVHSGQDGSLLHRVDAPVPMALFGHAVDGGADVDGDGHDDFAVGAPLADYAGQDAGSVFLYSGRTGAQLARFDGGAPHDMFGFAVVLTADMDGDGRGEVGGGGLEQFKGARGYVRMHSGATGAVLHTWPGDAIGDLCGWSLAAAGDVDNDGAADVIAGFQDHSSGNLFWRGLARVWSGASRCTRSSARARRSTSAIRSPASATSMRTATTISRAGRGSAAASACSRAATVR
jgi:hypothetical protein